MSIDKGSMFLTTSTFAIALTTLRIAFIEPTDDQGPRGQRSGQTATLNRSSTERFLKNFVRIFDLPDFERNGKVIDRTNTGKQ